MVAMRDVNGWKAAERHFGLTKIEQNRISKTVKTRPDLDRVYWQYRNAIARRWMSQLGETMSAILVKISATITDDTVDLQLLRELTRTVEIIGDISVSATAIAPDAISEDTPKYEIIDTESVRIEGARDASEGPLS